MESPIEIFIFGPELPSITFGSRLPYSHLNSVSFFSPSLFLPPIFLEGGAWRVHIPQAFMTCHKIVDCGHVQSTTPHPFWQVCPILWHWLCRWWHFESLLHGVREVDQKEVTKAELTKETESSVYPVLPCFRFPVLSSFISLLFLAQPRLRWGHFRNGTLALSLTFCFLPLPVAVMLKIAWRGTEWLVAANNYI